MTSSSSLYGTVTTQNTSSGNSTSLYGEAGTPIPDSSGNVVVRGDLYVLSGNILTTATTGNIFPANATTINLGLAATTVSIGAGSGTTTINNDLDVSGDITAEGADFGNITIGVATDNTITTTSGDLDITAIGNNGVNITSGNDAPTLITRNSNNTNTSTRSLALSVQSSGTPTVGFGNTLDFQLETAVGTTKQVGFINVVSTDLTSGSEDFTMGFGLMQNGAAYSSKMALDSTGSLALDNDLTIGGTNVNLAQGTDFLYSENNNRLNRPSVQSTTGLTSGFRVKAPSTASGATSTLSVSDSSDISNNTFMSLQAVNTATDPLRIFTGSYTAGVLGPSGDSISIRDGSTTYATINPAGPTIGSDLTTKTYVDAQIGTIPAYDTNVVSVTGGAELDLREVALGYTIVGSTKFLGGTNITVSETAPNEITISGSDLNTTYTIDASTTTGGANFNLVGSDASTDTVKFANGSNVTVTRTDANTITIASTDTNTTYTVDASSTTGGANLNLVGSDSTTDSVAYLGSGATTVTRTDANTITISSVDTNTTYTQDVSSTTGGANLNLVGSDSTTDSVKFAGGTNVSIVATDASTMTINATDTNTTYDFNATSTTGGANLNLVGSDSTTDTVKISNGTGVTVSQLSGTEVSVAIGQPVGTTDDVIFDTVDANITGGNYILGQIVATPVTSYVPPNSPLTTVSGSNGIAIASSTGNSPSVSARYFSGDTSAGVATAASFGQGGASGTSTSPGGNAANQVMGTFNFDGYTAGTSNGWAAQIATQNQGGGTIALQPLQAQGYARQAFTNSTTVTTAVTGASGTGSVATLTFTLQNLPPYSVGQSVTIAGMTPSGYNGTYTITAATTSSISYANATTGFTSGGTIGAANTVTAAGMGFRVRGWPNSTAMTPASRINFMDLTATTAAFKAGTYTFADEIVTGATSTSRTYLTLNSTSATFASAGNTYANLNSTNTLLSTGGVNYASMGAGGSTFTVTGINNFIRQGTTNTTQPALLVRYSRTDTTGSNDGDGVDFRLGTGGTVTTNNIARFDAQYKTSGLHQVGISVSTDSFAADTDTVYRAQADQTTLRTTPAGGGTAADTLTLTQLATTLKSDSVFLKDAAGTNIIGNNITYNRVYGQFQYNTTVTPAAANTAYVFPLGTTDFANITTVGSTSRLIPGAAGKYNFQFSVQVINADNGSEHFAYIWLRKNGVDVPGSMGRVTVVKNGGDIAAWNYIVDPSNSTDYFELAYAVDDTQVTFPAFAATAFGPSTATLITTLTPIGA